MGLGCYYFYKSKNSCSHLSNPPDAVARDKRQELTILGDVDNNIKNKYLDANIRKNKKIFT